MPQLRLPMIPQGATVITGLVTVFKDEEKWTYFYADQPIYVQKSDDRRMFRFITSQLIESGACRQTDIIRVFGVSKSSVIRGVKQLRDKGSESFFKRKKGRKSGTVLTTAKLEQSQRLFDKGYTRKEIVEEIEVSYDVFRKAISDGRLREPDHCDRILTKSARSVIDAEASEGMGTACTRVEERVLAARGELEGVETVFETCMDVPKGGVLCALPALLMNGLLKGVEQVLGKLKGYYTTTHILLVLAFMSLCRIRTAEKIRGQTPGEFGKLLGLDRIPEVRCLRNKMDALCAGDGAEQWAANLSKHWMEGNNEMAGTLYIDGHVRVYHGHLTKPPRHFVSRERLCLRGTTDYWVNDSIGRPFFVVEKPVDPGMIKTLTEDIVPRLLKDIPGLPTDQELAENPYLCRFIMVFDREGYSPAFFKEMWQKHRVACITYHKYPEEKWPEEWFTEQEVLMPNGEKVRINLAEMGSRIGSDKNGLWVKQVRKLTESGHQTSLISTAFELPHTQLAGRMFSRWCQENFFNYMMQHFGIDLILEYGVQDFPDTQNVINPVWRELNRKRNSIQNILRYRQARFAAMTLHPVSNENPSGYQKWLKNKSELFEEIQKYESQLEDLKTKIKSTKKHIPWATLEEKDRFHRLVPGRKQLMDTIRMIAYRAETTMVGLLTGPTVDSAGARQILQDLFVTEADILPDPDKNELRIRVHYASRPVVNKALASLFDHLNDAQIIYPGTNMKIIYELGGYKKEIRAEGVT